jgi:transcriptional regulator with XRE-family HTH domain
MSNSYAQALARYLAASDMKQTDLASAIRRTQVAVSRYANGERFPSADIAREIDTATQGAVPFSAWQAAAIERFGIGEAA